MTELELRPFVATSPLGLLAGLGVLDVVTRALPQRRVTLRWTEELAPHAVVSGPDSVGQVIDLVDDDRLRWATSPVLNWPPGTPLRDLKPRPEDLRAWSEAVVATLPSGRPDADLLCGLVAEGAVAGKGDTKPTHLHFTAGQQQFLDMARELRGKVTRDELVETLMVPWHYSSPLPSFGWDGRGERIHALRGANPSGEKRTGQAGAEWLAFLGLSFLPVVARRGGLETTGCDRAYKGGAFTWPVWVEALDADVVRSLLADASLAYRPEAELTALGIIRVLRTPIRRTDQGGYGSFGPPGGPLKKRGGNQRPSPRGSSAQVRGTGSRRRLR